MRGTYNTKTMQDVVLVMFLIVLVRNRRTSLPTPSWTQQVHIHHLSHSLCIENICLACVNNTWRACHYISLIWLLTLLLSRAPRWLQIWPNGHLMAVVEKPVSAMAASEHLVCCISASRCVALCINNTTWWRRMGSVQGYKCSYVAARGCLYCGLAFSRGHFRISNTLPDKLPEAY